ncbi:transcriptional regulator PdhR [Paraferrimonas haliotis]|uniref:Pyruvate dehydrogenase complex repressor n=2 Tax=Paraferrimonas haliotis TaxID=2013866 RepID=A0AA37WWC9_9GAMM|nr:transcriptional regulator PdhR [Paraferrimonas haliotis]
MILEGSLTPGEKLPPERELAVQFEVSRPSLREAIQKLEAKGLLTRRQGGGTYVQEQLWQSFSDPVLELMSTDPESQFDLLEFRHATEGMMAYFAALRGTDTDFERIHQALQTLRAGGDIDAQANAMVALYKTIAEAAHNSTMLHLVLSLTPVLQNNIVQNLKLLMRSPEALDKTNQLREAMVSAVTSRDPKAARRASNEHLAYIEEVLLNLRREDTRQQRSLRRLRGDR